MLSLNHPTLVMQLSVTVKHNVINPALPVNSGYSSLTPF